MMKSMLLFLFALLLPLLLLGCTPPAPTDVPIKAALDAVLQSDEFTQEERDAFQSVSVHNDEAKVWLKANFSTEEKTIIAVSKHIGQVFAETFRDAAMDSKYKRPKYNVEVWMKITDDKGSHNALVAEYFYNLGHAKVEGEQYGLGAVKGIR